ncbi:hypothetical protein [Macrococcoides canis]|uniref:hypothetical protein n=1 Tax=Macrococcoides canis TaxID=1855823 RepID=UPI00165D7B46|nr:hypothetical protein [Macrococcus canis]QNR09105.1 hypothetical protein GL258_12530 [Macrococcus canis]
MIIESKFVNDKELYKDYLELKEDIYDVIKNYYYSLYDFTKQDVIDSKQEIDAQFEFEPGYTLTITDSDEDTDVVAVYLNRLKESDSLLFDDINKAYVRFFYPSVISHLVAELIIDEKLTDRTLTIYRNDYIGEYDLEEAEVIAIYNFAADNTYELITYKPSF